MSETEIQNNLKSVLPDSQNQEGAVLPADNIIAPLPSPKAIFTQEKPLPETVITPEAGSQNEIPLKSNTKKNNFNFSKLDFIFIFVLILAGVNILISVFLYNISRNYKTFSNQILLSKDLKKKQISINIFEKIDNIDKYLPKEKDVITLVNNLNEAGKSFENFSLTFAGETPIKTDAYYLPIIISLTGKKENIVLFLQEILNMNYILDVQNLDLGFKKLSGTKVDPTKTEAIIKINLLISDKFNQ